MCRQYRTFAPSRFLPLLVPLNDLELDPQTRGAIERNWRSIFIGLTIGVDLVSILCAALTAGVLRNLFPNVPDIPPQSLAGFSVYFTAVLVGFGLLIGLYRGAFHLSYRRQYFLAARAYVLSLLVVLSTFYLLHVVDFPRRFTLIFFLSLPIFFSFGRLVLNILNERLQKQGFGMHRVLMAGYDGEVESLIERFEAVPELGYEVRGVVRKQTGSGRRTLEVDDRALPVVGLKELGPMVRKERIDRIFVPSPSVLSNGFSSVLDVCRQEGVKLKVLSREHEVLLSLARVYDMAGITLYSPPRFHVEALRRWLKRSFDFFGSLVIILLLSPVFILTSLLIAIESGFPIFFTQKRASIKGGKTFGFIKFRSMVRNADELKADLMKFNESDGALFKMKNDPRVTRVGRFIRKYSIDELPQLFNVLKGDMSLVGPRPLPIKDFEILDETQEFWDSIKDREKVKPGMTGLWQISGRSNIGFKEMVLLDLYYVENHSILFDLEILFGTIPVVLFGRGAY